ncbi:MAG: type II secretion system F family protein [Dehalococcoidia bacterium]
MPLLITLSVFVTVAALAYAFTAGREVERPNLQQRISGSRVSGVDAALAKANRPGSSVPQTVLRVVRRYLPAEMLDTVATDLVKAGNPTSLQKMVMAWVIGIVILPLIYAFIVLSKGTAISTLQFISLAIVPILGFYIPRMWLQGKVKKRRKQILKSLPDAMDLITTSVEAGLGIDASFARVADKVRGPIAEEFRRCLREMSLGRTRREALTDFAERTELEDVSTFINAVVQAENTGVSLGRVVRIQADQLRIKRKQRAEAQAQKAPVKMVIPLVLFIFPAMFIVILGPAAIQIIESNK